MVEEYTSALVETIVMERAKLASYMMRAPFLLSQPPAEGSPERRGKRDKDPMAGSSSGLSLSPDLNDSIHVISVGVKTCNATVLKLRSMFQSDGDESINRGVQSIMTGEPSNMLYYGCHSIQEALKFAIGQKLLDIAIDPQGMTPEIYVSGARQFRHDVMAFESLFQTDDSARKLAHATEPGPMERAVTASNLMSLGSSQIQAIREALRALVLPGASMGSLFGRRGGDLSPSEIPGDEAGRGHHHRLDADDFYSDERLMEEAANMLEAKGFGALSLDEALSIINRRIL